MNAASWILSHKDLMNVTGAEGQLRERIQFDLEATGIRSDSDELGCLFVPGEIKGVFVSAMMDVPGYLYLKEYEDHVYLVSTLNKAEERDKAFRVFNEKGDVFQIKLHEKPDLYRSNSKKKFEIGTPFKEEETIREEAGFLYGRNVTRYSLLYILYRLAQSGKVGVLFASHGRSNAPVEYNFALREKMKTAFLLGAVESDVDQPYVVIRDGRCFSDPALAGKAKKAGFHPIVTDEVLTKAFSCANAGVRTLTLALPYRQDKDGERVVSLRSVDEIYEMILKLF